MHFRVFLWFYLCWVSETIRMIRIIKNMKWFRVKLSPFTAIAPTSSSLPPEPTMFQIFLKWKKLNTVDTVNVSFSSFFFHAP